MNSKNIGKVDFPPRKFKLRELVAQLVRASASELCCISINAFCTVWVFSLILSISPLHRPIDLWRQAKKRKASHLCKKAK